MIHQFTHQVGGQFSHIIFYKNRMRGGVGVQTYYMNCLPNNTGERASGSSQVVVSLIATETTVLSTTGNTPVSGPTVEEKLQHRAEAMTDVLTEIMDRPVTQRFWGLNE